MFFVLSGFCITYLVEKHHSVLGFYFRRLIRLYAPFLAGLLLAWFTYILFSSLGGNLDFNNAKAIQPFKSVFSDYHTTARNLFYLPSGSFIAQYWSLTYEIMFYIISPFVLSKKLRVWYLIISALLFLVGHLTTQGNGVFTLFLFEYNFYFAVGVLLFEKFELFSSAFGLKNNKLLLIVFGCFLPVILMSYRFNEEAGLLITALLAVVMIVNSLKLNLFENNKLIYRLGELSYTLYLTHFASIFIWAILLSSLGFVSSIPNFYNWLWISSVPFSIIISMVFFELVEKKTLKILARLRNK